MSICQTMRRTALRLVMTTSAAWAATPAIPAAGQCLAQTAQRADMASEHADQVEHQQNP